MSNLLDGQAGPWFNNINATPVSAAPNNIYGTVGIQRLQHNLPAVQAFRASAADAVTQALQDLGAEVQLQHPAGEPAPVQEHGLGAGQPGHPARCPPTCRPTRRSTRRCSTTARAGPTRSRSASAGSRRWATSASTTRAPTRSWAGTTTRTRLATRASRRSSGEFGQDSTSDYFSNLNYWASGTVHGPGGFDKPSEGPAARRRVHRDVVLVRDRLAAGGRPGQPAEPADRLLRDDAEEADRADDGHLRRRLQPHEERLDGRPDVLLGLRGRQPDGEDRRTR